MTVLHRHAALALAGLGLLALAPGAQAAPYGWSAPAAPRPSTLYYDTPWAITPPPPPRASLPLPPQATPYPRSSAGAVPYQRAPYGPPPASQQPPYGPPVPDDWQEAQMAQRCNVGRLVGGLFGGAVGYGVARGEGRSWAVPLGALLGQQMGCNMANSRTPLPW